MKEFTTQLSMEAKLTNMSLAMCPSSFRFVILFLTALHLGALQAEGLQISQNNPSEELALLQMVEPLLKKQEKKPYEEVMSHLPESPLEAIRALEALGKERSAIMNFLLGNLYLSQQREADGVLSLKAAIKKFPNFLQAHRSLANAHAALGHLDQALEHTSRAIALGGADAQLYGLLAYLHYEKNNHASALSAYRLASMFDPENQNYAKGELYSLASTGHQRDVLARLDSMLPKQPYNSQYWVLKANAHLSLKENEEAMVTFETLRQMKQADAATLSRLSQLYFNEGLHQEAVKVIEEALAKGASPSTALSVLEGLIALNATKLATRLSKALPSPPWGSEDQTGRHELALAQLSFQNGDNSGAEKQLRSLLQRYPTHGSGLLSLARLLQTTNRGDEAKIHYERAATFEEVQQQAWNELAQLSWREGNTTDTLIWLEKSQSLNPSRELMETIERLKRDLSSR